MKRTAVLILAAVLTFSLCGCIGKDLSGGNGSSSAASQTKPIKDDRDRNIAEKLTEEIDGAYKKDGQLIENQSTVGMIDLADKYAKKWEEVAEEYYDKLICVQYDVSLDGKEYKSKDFQKYISNLKKIREKEIEKNKEEYQSSVAVEYDGGSIIGPLCAEYNYELQMKWALELVGIYCNFEYIG